MNIIEKSESIRAGLRKGFQDGTSKITQRKCYGYDVGADGALVVNLNEASVVCWIFDRYLSGDSLGKIAAGLETQGVPSPTGRPKWSREAISKLISNEKYTGRVLLQKTISAGGSQMGGGESAALSNYGVNTTVWTYGCNLLAIFHFRTPFLNFRR